MGFGVSIVTFSPNSTIKSADVNNNFFNLNNATDFQGNWDTATAGVSLYVNDESVGGTQSINIKPTGSSPARTVTISSRDGSGVMHPGLFVDLVGNVNVTQAVILPGGSVRRMSGITGTGSVTVNHGLGSTPGTTVCQYAGNYGTAPTPGIFTQSASSSQVTIGAASGVFWNGMCYIQ